MNGMTRCGEPVRTRIFRRIRMDERSNAPGEKWRGKFRFHIDAQRPCREHHRARTASNVEIRCRLAKAREYRKEREPVAFVEFR